MEPIAIQSGLLASSQTALSSYAGMELLAGITLGEGALAMLGAVLLYNLFKWLWRGFSGIHTGPANVFADIHGNPVSI